MPQVQACDGDASVWPELHSHQCQGRLVVNNWFEWSIYPSFSKDNGLNAQARDGGTAGVATRAKGFLAYHEICRHIKSGWTVVQVLTLLVKIMALNPYFPGWRHSTQNGPLRHQWKPVGWVRWQGLWESKISTEQQNYLHFLGCYCEKMQLCEGQWLWWRHGLGPGFGWFQVRIKVSLNHYSLYA